MTIDFSTYENNPTDPHMMLGLANSLAAYYLYETSLTMLESILRLDNVDPDLIATVRDRICTASHQSKDASRRARARMMSNEISLDRSIHEDRRARARENNILYATPLSEMMSSTSIEKFSFDAPTDYYPCNTSVHRYNGRLWMSQRRVNYDIFNGMATVDGGQFSSKNWILELNEDLSVCTSGELLRPEGMPGPLYPGASGFEDLRLFTWKGELWTSFSTWDLNTEHRMQMAMGKIVPMDMDYTLADWKVLEPTYFPIYGYQKNWMPFVQDDRLRFVYASDPVRVLDEGANTVILNETSIVADHFRGGTQLIQLDSGWLALIHEMHATTHRAGRYYLHRFVWYDSHMRLCKITLPFFFRELAVEFASGMEYLDGNQSVIISFGVDDQHSYMATVDIDDIRAALRNV